MLILIANVDLDRDLSAINTEYNGKGVEMRKANLHQHLLNTLLARPLNQMPKVWLDKIFDFDK